MSPSTDISRNSPLEPPPQELHAKLQAQVSELIARINGKLTPSERQKLITLCTVDVHARDVVQRLIEEKVDSVNAFQWQSQLRYYQSPQSKECMVGPGAVTVYRATLGMQQDMPRKASWRVYVYTHMYMYIWSVCPCPWHALLIQSHLTPGLHL